MNDYEDHLEDAAWQLMEWDLPPELLPLMVTSAAVYLAGLHSQ